MSVTETSAASTRLWLAELIAEKRRRNPALSLRAFARLLGVSPATLSQVLAGKRNLSRKFARKVATRLALSPAETHALLRTRAAETELLELDRFNVIADWYHFAILSLSEVNGSCARPEWIARRLNIPRRQAREALDRLLRLGLVEIRGDRFRQVPPSLDTPTEVPSAALRRHHQQILQKADVALCEVPLAEREFGTMTMAIDPSKLAFAKKRLREFRHELSEILETGKKEKVYILSFQLFPLEATGEEEVPT